MKRALLVVMALAAPARADTIAITHATVWQTPTQKLDDATVIIENGKITAVGATAKIPAGATTIDGTGKVVTAGLIEASTSLGLVTIDLEGAANDGDLGDTPGDEEGIHAAYRVTDAYDADAVTIPIARAGGITTVVVAPSGGLVSGQSAVFSLADGGTVDDAVKPTAAMHALLGHIVESGGSRGRAIERLRELLDDAATYKKTKGAFDKNQSRELAADRLDLEALAPVLAGTVPLVVRADAEADLRAALKLAQARKLKLVIEGGAEAWKLADELAKAKVPVILDPTDNLPGNLDAPDVRDDSAKALDDAGVTVGISTLGNGNSPGVSNARVLRQLAGIAVGNGLSWADALAAITTIPAKIYGLAGRGSVTKGAVADVVVWDGDPFELDTKAEVVIVGGKQQSLETHQTRLLGKYRHL